jgi:hypothetical protein
MDGIFVTGCPAPGAGAPFGTYGCVRIPTFKIDPFMVPASFRDDPTQPRNLLASGWPAAAILAAAAGALLAVSARRRRHRAIETPSADGAGAQML